MMNKKSWEHSRNLFFLMFQGTMVGLKLLHIGISSNSFLQFPQKILIFRKNCSIKFVIKEVILNFDVRWSLLLKKCSCPQTIFWPLCTNFCPTQHKKFFIAPINTSYRWVISTHSTDQEHMATLSHTGVALTSVWGLRVIKIQRTWCVSKNITDNAVPRPRFFWGGWCWGLGEVVCFHKTAFLVIQDFLQ